MMIGLLSKLGKKHFKVNPWTDNYVNKRKRIYLIGCWARYGVWEYPLAYYKKGMPYVWYYDDNNGVFEEYMIVPIVYVTTGTIVSWTEDRGAAECQAIELNAEMEGKL